MIRRSCRCICPVVALLVLTPALFPGCSDSVPPNVLLLTLDTTRADYIGCYGITDVETPVIDALAAAGTRFARNVSASQCTNPAHASILTGLYVARHQVYDNETPMSEAARTLTEVLQDQGYATLGAVSARHLNPGNSGFG